MEKNSKSYSVQSLVNDIARYDKGVEKGKDIISGISLKHKLQRKEGQWNTSKKSLLIDSAFRDYPTFPIYLIKNNGDNARYVIDGIQRLSTFRDYVNDKFALSKDLLEVKIDGSTHIIAGKKFSKLDEECQNVILAYNIDTCTLNNPSSEDIKNVFSRLNNGKPLSNSSLRVVYMSDKVLDFLTEMTEKPFMKAITSPTQEKSDVNRDWIVQTMMLLENSNEHDYLDFKKKRIDEFVHYDMDNIDKIVYDSISLAIDKLSDAFENEEVKIATTSVPFVLYAATKCIDNLDLFLEVLRDFIDNYDNNETYKRFLESGTSGKESLTARYNYWNELIKDYI